MAAAGSCVATPHAGGLWNVAVAADGKTAYGTAWDDDALLVFDRDPATGRLTQRTCFSEAGVGGCPAAFGLHEPDGVALSGDGKSLYVASWDGALATFKRDPAGGLTFTGCFSGDKSSAGVANKCALGRGLSGARDVHVSADDKNVYAGPAGAIASFSRTDAGLQQLGGSAGCVTAVPADGCASVSGLGASGRQFALSADGTSVYAGADSLAIIKRNRDTGALSQEPGTASCFAVTGGDCTALAKLAGTVAMVVGPGDKQVYATTNDGVLVFKRAAGGGLTLQSCINTLGNDGCGSRAKVVQGLTYFAISPDGEDLVADVDGAPAGIVTLSRDSAGDLTQRTGTSDVCVTTDGTGGCLANAQIAGDGRIVFADNNVFHVGVYRLFPAGALMTFKRDFPPVCAGQTVAVARDTSVAVPFGCSDRNADPITYTLLSNPVAGNLGAIDQAGGRVFYNPFGGFVGADSFKFRAAPPARRRRTRRSRSTSPRRRPPRLCCRPASTPTTTASSPGRTATTPTPRSAPARARSRATGSTRTATGSPSRSRR